MYVSVRQGDRLPTVALAQALLAEHGIDVVADGHFGVRTVRAVLAYQDSIGLSPTGQVDPPTWTMLRQNHPLEVVEAIDAADITVLEEDAPFLNDGHSHVVESYGASRGTRHLIDRLVRNNRPRSVALLRFHGHGAPGGMAVSCGTESGGSIGLNHFAQPEAVAAYARLGTIMKRYGSIELHGCNVAMRPNGPRLLERLSRTCGVPVSAAVQLQSGAIQASRFEGAVRTVCPGGMSLSAWAASVFAMSGW